MSSQIPRYGPASTRDFDAMYAVINAAATAYAGVIPADRYHVPYMPDEELRDEIAAGVRFWGWYDPEGLSGVMGIQDVDDVTLIRHAYVTPERQGAGIGSRLLAHLLSLPHRPVLVGTWADAAWAVRFYERHGFRLVTRPRRTACCGATGVSPHVRSTLRWCYSSLRAEAGAFDRRWRRFDAGLKERLRRVRVRTLGCRPAVPGTCHDFNQYTSRITHDASITAFRRSRRTRPKRPKRPGSLSSLRFAREIIGGEAGAAALCEGRDPRAGKSRAGEPQRRCGRCPWLYRELRLDEDHQGLGQDTVVRHRLGHRFGLHRGHEAIHIGDVHEDGHLSPVLWIDERPDVGDPEGPEDLFALWRFEPVVRILDIVISDHGRHGASLASWPTYLAGPADCPRDRRYLPVAALGLTREAVEESALATVGGRSDGLAETPKHTPDRAGSRDGP